MPVQAGHRLQAEPPSLRLNSVSRLHTVFEAALCNLGGHSDASEF